MSNDRKDKHTPEQRSYNMSQIRSKGTKLELTFFNLLDTNGIIFTPHPKLFGKPDCLIEPGIVVFVDSDFWHGWHFPKWKDRLPQEYWVEKIERNIRRDYQKFRSLRSQGYKVVRIWEHTIKKNPERAVAIVQKAINETS